MFLTLCLVAVSCSSASEGASESAAPCEQLASEVAAEFATVLDSVDEIGIETLLATGSQAYEDFQQQVTDLVVESEAAGNCSPVDRDEALEVALGEVEASGAAGAFVLDSVLNSQRRAVRTVSIDPDDDVLAVLNRLGPGSVLTLRAGTYDLGETMLVPVGLTIQGAGAEETVIQSSAPDAAMVVYGDGGLVMRDVTMRHVGEEAASVLLVFGRDLQLDRVTVTGGVVAADGSAGNGLVLRGAATAGPDGALVVDPNAAPAEMSVADSSILDNGAAGVIGAETAVVEMNNTLVSNNVGCGVCWQDDASGVVEGLRVEQNGAGLQFSDRSKGTVTDSQINDNATVGLSLDDEANLLIEASEVSGNEGGLQAAGSAVLTINDSTAQDNTIALAVEDQAVVALSASRFIGGVAQVQVLGSAQVTATNNSFSQSAEAAILVGAQAELSMNQAMVSVIGDGFIVGGGSHVTLTSVTVDGGRSAIVFGDEASGTVTNTVLSNQEVAIAINGTGSPDFSEVQITDSMTAGIVVAGSSQPNISRSTVAGAGQVAIQVGEDAKPVVVDNTLTGTGSGTGLSALGTSVPLFERNKVEGFGVGVDVSQQASPEVMDNEILDATRVGMSFTDEAAGTASGNTILNPGDIGIQVTDRSAPILRLNVIGANPDAVPASAETREGEARASTVGILFAGGSTGSAEANEILNFIVGIQVGDIARPSVLNNQVDGGGLEGFGLLYLGAGAGQVSGNMTSDHSVGFQVGGSAAPDLQDNVVNDALQAAFVIGGDALPSVSGNSCPPEILGIIITDAATPELGENDCVIARP